MFQEDIILSIINDVFIIYWLYNLSVSSIKIWNHDVPNTDILKVQFWSFSRKSGNPNCGTILR
jgi:hypothetical protein